MNIDANAEPGIKGWNLRHGRVQSVDLRDFAGIDCCAAGPPCTPFSVAGKLQGRADSRDMLPQFVRAVLETEPKSWMFENVQGLAWDRFRPYLDYVLLQLTHPTLERKPGERWTHHLARLKVARRRPHYSVAWRVLNAADYGVPQMRWRLFAVGVDPEFARDFIFPVETHSADALLWSQWVSGDYWKRHGLRQPHTPSRLGHRVKNLEQQAKDGTLAEQAPWVTVRDALGDLPVPTTYRDAGPSGHWVQPGARRYDGHDGSPWDMPSKTLKAGAHGVPGGENMLRQPNGKVRYFTIRELARLQTFPDAWSFSGEWGPMMRQVGNAAPVDLVHAIAGRVKAALGDQMVSDQAA